jgi:hypothetical protein
MDSEGPVAFGTAGRVSAITGIRAITGKIFSEFGFGVRDPTGPWSRSGRVPPASPPHRLSADGDGR